MMQILAVSVPLEEFLSILGKFHARGSDESGVNAAAAVLARIPMPLTA